MANYDVEKAHKETIEYYRYVMLFHQKDPHAKKSVEADREMLEMIKVTPDVVEMNRKMMNEGYVLNVAKGITADGNNLQAESYDKLEETALAGHYRERAKRVLEAKSHDEIDSIIEEMEHEKDPIQKKEARLKFILDVVIEKLFLTDASPAGSGLDNVPKQTMTALLDELKELMPGIRFPELMRIPRLRKRIYYSDQQLDQLSELFEKVNKERLGGKY